MDRSASDEEFAPDFSCLGLVSQDNDKVDRFVSHVGQNDPVYRGEGMIAAKTAKKNNEEGPFRKGRAAATA